MKLSHDALAGTLVIALLVIAGVWYAQVPDGQRWPLPNFGTARDKARVPLGTINGISWSADARNRLYDARTGTETNRIEVLGPESL